MIGKVRKLIVFYVLAGIFFYNGCGFFGLMGTESPYEKRIPAEYNLTKLEEKRILVLVERPRWLDTDVSLRYYLTRGINRSLISKVKIPAENIISYDELSDFRSERNDFLLLSPVEVGKALGVDIVLLVKIKDYQLSEMHGTDYYEGVLGVQSVIFEAGGKGRVWPDVAEGKSVKVGFEAERGRDGAVNRLVSACAHCITRYFYNCPQYKFRISEEMNPTGWED